MRGHIPYRRVEWLLEIEGASPDGFCEVWLSANGRLVASCVLGGGIDGDFVIAWARERMRRLC